MPRLFAQKPQRAFVVEKSRFTEDEKDWEITTPAGSVFVISKLPNSEVYVLVSKYDGKVLGQFEKKKDAAKYIRENFQ